MGRREGKKAVEPEREKGLFHSTSGSEWRGRGRKREGRIPITRNLCQGSLRQPVGLLTRSSEYETGGKKCVPDISRPKRMEEYSKGKILEIVGTRKPRGLKRDCHCATRQLICSKKKRKINQQGRKGPGLTYKLNFLLKENLSGFLGGARKCGKTKTESDQPSPYSRYPRRLCRSGGGRTGLKERGKPSS